METEKQDDATRAAYDAETNAILAAKRAAGILYPLLVITTTDPVDPSRDGPRFAFRRPTQEEWHRYRAENVTADPNVRANAFQTIVVPCCLYPPQASALAAFAERPGLVEQFGGELVEFAGAERAKKVERL
jgi:hypothetical protein